MKSGSGCRLTDTAGRKYLDFSMAGALAYRARASAVVRAVTDQAVQGSNFAYLNAHALAVAEEIRSRQLLNAFGSAHLGQRPLCIVSAWPVQ